MPPVAGEVEGGVLGAGGEEGEGAGEGGGEGEGGKVVEGEGGKEGAEAGEVEGGGGVVGRGRLARGAVPCLLAASMLFGLLPSRVLCMLLYPSLLLLLFLC